MYIKTPIYLRRNYFSYYFSKNEEYKFDIDDLFFYSQHKILRRGGRLFVNEYGMQTSIFSLPKRLDTSPRSSTLLSLAKFRTTFAHPA